MPRILIVEGNTTDDHIKYDKDQGAFLISYNKKTARMYPGTPYHFKDKTGIDYQISLHNEFGQPTLYRRHVENQQWVYEHSINLNNDAGPYWENSVPTYNLDRLNSRFPANQYEANPAQWQQFISGNNDQPKAIEIFRSSTELLSYDGENKKLYYKTKTTSDSDFLHVQEVNLSNAKVFPAIFENGRYYQAHFSSNPPGFDLHGVRRYIDENDNSWHYESLLEKEDGTGLQWGAISAEAGADHYFPWLVEKQYPLVIKQNVDAENNKLSNSQIKDIASILNPPILALKQSCDTRDQFENCLIYLIEEQTNIPPNLSNETKQRLSEAKYYLTEAGLHHTKINSSTAFQGHFVTIGETKQYMLSLIKQTLNQIAPAYNYNLSDDYNNDYWNILVEPDLAGRERSFPEEKEIKEILQLICKVQKLNATEIKDDATLQDLEQLAKKLQKLLDPELKDGIPFVERIKPFLRVLANHVTYSITTFSRLPDQTEPEPTGLKESFLLPLYRKVFEKLQQLGAGNITTPEQLENTYLQAWNNPNSAPPQEVIAPPVPAPQQNVQGIEGKDFLNPGFRTRFKQWFEEKHLGELVEHTDEANGSRSLRGTLSTGVGVIIYRDKMVLDTEASLSGEAFKNSMREMIAMYKDAYKPGNPPPTTPLGTSEQKRIISQLLEEAGIEVKKPAQPTNSPAQDSTQPPAPRM